MLNKEELSGQIAYITINPGGRFMKSAQMGFSEVGLNPKFLIHVNPKNRLQKEFKKYRLGIFKSFLIQKFKQHYGNTQSFSEETINIPIEKTFKVNALNDTATAEIIINNNIKYLINCGAGIFRKKLLSIEGLKVFNAHAGKLPEYQNMNVVDWAIYNNEDVVGTIHLIDEGIDTGDILTEKVLDVSKMKTLEDARNSAFDQVIKLMGKTVLDYANNTISAQKQIKKGKKWYVMHAYFKQKINDQLAQKNK